MRATRCSRRRLFSGEYDEKQDQLVEALIARGYEVPQELM